MLVVPNLSAGTDFVVVGDAGQLIENENAVSAAILTSQEPLHLAATLPLSIGLEHATIAPTASLEESVVRIIANSPVHIARGHPTIDEMDESISQINSLIEILKNVPANMFYKGVSPGYETVASLDPRWVKKTEFELYESLPSVNAHGDCVPLIPVPSPADAMRYYTAIKDTWVERRRCLLSMGGHQMKNWQDYSFCSCISAWPHLRGDLLWSLSNQSLEQNMIREASLATTVHLKDDPKTWNRLYSEDFCPSPMAVRAMYKPNIAVRLMLSREEFIETFINLALQAKHRIDISTCYLFNECPAHRYILMDLLPYVARVKGVKVRVLCDMKPIESRILMSALKPKARGIVDIEAQKLKTEKEWAFLDRIPKDAPPVSQDVRKDISALDFFTKVLEIAHSIPGGGYSVKWWCARDAKSHYRIKSHLKCAVFDGSRELKGRTRGMALLGGSNLCPVARDSDLDILVSGEEIVDQLGDTFEWLWGYMRQPGEVDSQNEVVDTTDEEKKEESEIVQSTEIFPQHKWTDECHVAYVRSESSSVGNTDYILRHVLGAIASAEESIIMCMGHMNVPEPVAEQLAKAVQRGVRVKLLVNSFASSDVRFNQRDSFKSVKYLLKIAPEVEVWTTALRSDRPALSDNIVDENGAPLPEYASFLHSKYTVVDGKWSAMGSWNLWTRCAFYEIEHELLIESETIAKHLTDKFEIEKKKWCVRLESMSQCDFYCPKGCHLCTPFGPFYR